MARSCTAKGYRKPKALQAAGGPCGTRCSRWSSSYDTSPEAPGRRPLQCRRADTIWIVVIDLVVCPSEGAHPLRPRPRRCLRANRRGVAAPRTGPRSSRCMRRCTLCRKSSHCRRASILPCKLHRSAGWPCTPCNNALPPAPCCPCLQHTDAARSPCPSWPRCLSGAKIASSFLVRVNHFWSLSHSVPARYRHR